MSEEIATLEPDRHERKESVFLIRRKADGKYMKYAASDGSKPYFVKSIFDATPVRWNPETYEEIKEPSYYVTSKHAVCVAGCETVSVDITKTAVVWQDQKPEEPPAPTKHEQTGRAIDMTEEEYNKLSDGAKLEACIQAVKEDGQTNPRPQLSDVLGKTRTFRGAPIYTAPKDGPIIDPGRLLGPGDRPPLSPQGQKELEESKDGRYNEPVQPEITDGKEDQTETEGTTEA